MLFSTKLLTTLFLLTASQALARKMKKKSGNGNGGNGKGKSTEVVETTNICLCEETEFVFEPMQMTWVEHQLRAFQMGCYLATAGTTQASLQALYDAVAMQLGTNPAYVGISCVDSGPPVWQWIDDCSGSLTTDALFRGNQYNDCPQQPFGTIRDNNDQALVGSRGGPATLPAVYECCVEPEEPTTGKSKSSKNGRGMMMKSSSRRLQATAWM